MIVKLKSVLQGPCEFDFTLGPDWWRGQERDDRVLGMDDAFVVHIDISKQGSMFVLDGNLSGNIVMQCDRCLEPYNRPLKADFRLFLTTAPAIDGTPVELELAEEDLSVEYITGDEIHLDGIAREQIFLSLPIKSLCRDDCSGLCPVCGSNLNKTSCTCRVAEGHPGLSRLKAWIPGGKKEALR
jgi:uncharacterized protein